MNDYRRDVRYGSKADMTALVAMSAIPPKADKLRGSRFVRFVPIADIACPIRSPRRREQVADEPRQNRRSSPYEEMTSHPPVLTTEHCRAKEAECRHMSTIGSLAPGRRLELLKQADDWAVLAAAQETLPLISGV